MATKVSLIFKVFRPLKCQSHFQVKELGGILVGHFFLN